MTIHNCRFAGRLALLASMFCMVSVCMVSSQPACALSINVVGALRTGDSEPEGFGEFAAFDQVQVNDAGQMLFRGSLSLAPDGATAGVYVRETNGLTRKIARQFDSIPGGGLGFSSQFDLFSLNSNGQVAFRATPTFGSDGPGIYRHNGTAVEQILLQDSPIPGLVGVSAGPPGHPFLDDQGKVHVITGNSVLVNVALDGSAIVDEIVGTIIGPLLPPLDNDLDAVVTALASLAINRNSVTVYQENLTVTNPPSNSMITAVASTLDGETELLVHAGVNLPDGGGRFSLLLPTVDPQINDNNVAAFGAAILPTGGSLTGSIFVSNPLAEIIRNGDDAPAAIGINGTFDGLGDPLINNLNDVVFEAISLQGTLGGGGDNSGLFFFWRSTCWQATFGNCSRGRYGAWRFWELLGLR